MEDPNELAIIRKRLTPVPLLGFQFSEMTSTSDWRIWCKESMCQIVCVVLKTFSASTTLSISSYLPTKVILVFSIRGPAKQTLSCSITSYVTLIALIRDMLTSCSWYRRALGRRHRTLEYVHGKDWSKAWPSSYRVNFPTPVKLEVPPVHCSTQGISCRRQNIWDLCKDYTKPGRNNSIHTSTILCPSQAGQWFWRQ